MGEPHGDREEIPDVVVIGGGPAGSTAASLAARNGLRVVLFERERFPRPHVGESLLPASLPILDHLGVRGAIERAGFTRKRGATMVWGSDRAPWTWSFAETPGPYQHAYQVNRAEFDQILLDHAARNGVDVRLDHRVASAHFEGDALSHLVVERPGGSQFEQRARLVVDASGQHALLASRRSERAWDPFFRNLALYAYYEGADHLDPPHEGNIFIESIPGGWLWKIPLKDGISSVGAVVDAEWAQPELRGADPDRLSAVFEDLIAQGPRTAALLAGATRTGPPAVVKDWSYMAEHFVGPGYILAGDAACFVDPLFSTGVHLALTSGLLAAAYASTVLKHPERREAAAAAYEQQYRRKYHYFRELAKLFYSSNRSVDSYFWEARRLADDDWEGTPRQAFLNLVAGHPPEGYERAVIERGAPPPALVEQAASLGRERQRRGEALQSMLRGSMEGGSRDGRLPQWLVPRLTEGVRLRADMAVVDGEFQPAALLVTPREPAGEHVIPPVAQLIALIDGRRDLRGIVRSMRAPLSPQHYAELERSVHAKLQQFYVDGVVEWDADIPD